MSAPVMAHKSPTKQRRGPVCNASGHLNTICNSCRSAGKPYVDLRSQPLTGAVSPDPPTVLLDNLARDVQAKTQTWQLLLLSVARPAERLKDGFRRLDRQADACVRHAHQHPRAVG